MPSSFSERTKPNGSSSFAGSNSNNNNKSVRFSSQEGGRPKKRPRIERPDEDETDDADAWINDDEQDEDGTIPSERDLVEAKRSRRLKRTGQDLDDDDDQEETRIDSESSLLASNEHTEVPVEPFNMNAERTDGSGYFEGDTYVFRKRDDEGEPDAWLESLDDDNKDGKSQAYATIAKPRAATATPSKNNDTSMDDWNKEELYAKILPLVSDSETILQALVRYGALMKRREQQGDEAQKRSRAALNDLTLASNALLLRGDVDIYQRTRNDLMKIAPEERATTTVPDSDKRIVQWEYKGNQDGQIHGPYSTQEMLSWTQAGYFIGAQAVQIRTMSTGDAPKKSTADELLSDLMEDDDESDVPPVTKGEWISSNDVDFMSYA